MRTPDTLQDARQTWLVVNPTHADVLILACETRDAAGTLTAHPDTLHELHAACVHFGPMIARTRLAAVLDVTVTPDPGLPPGLVVLL